MSMTNENCQSDLKSLSTLILNKQSAGSSNQPSTALPLEFDMKAAVEPEVLEASIRIAQEHLLKLQTPDGSWKGHNTLGPVDTARALIFERYLGILNYQDASEGARWLRGQQREDGSFPPYHFADEGDFNITCYAYAGMRAAGIQESDLAVQKAWQFIEVGGGFGKARLDAQVFLVMAGLLEPEKLPSPSLLHKLIPGFERLMVKFLGSWVVLGFNQMPALIRGLKDKRKPPNWLLHPIRRLENRRVIDYLTHRQNPSGEWYGTAFNTMLGAACLYSLGVPLSDPRIQKALKYVDRSKVYGPEGMYAVPWTSEIWDTACIVHALVGSEIAPDHPCLQRAARYLLEQQGKLPIPKDWQNPKRRTPRTGAWAYQEGNQLACDTDCTAAVLTALKGIAAKHPSSTTQEAIEKGIAWELEMQNRDGGWGAWSRGHATKKPGPMPPHPLSKRNPPPMILTDSSTEGLTGRVLYALSQYGYSKDDPVIQKAISFLQNQRDKNGVWWGRWFVNYLAGTSYVLCGLRAVGENMNESYVRQAVEWLKSRQNEDGGWGEGVESYENPSMAGVGKSSPTITGLVISALIDAGEGDSQAVQRGVHYLVRQQSDRGTWEEQQVLGVAFPSIKLYYHNELFPKYSALQALGKYRAFLTSRRESK